VIKYFVNYKLMYFWPVTEIIKLLLHIFFF
jgi:hypothetical protein